MNIKGDFNRLGKLDVSAIRAKVEAYSEDIWSEDTSRQKIFDAHTDTQTIKLLFDPDYRHTDPTEHPALKEYAALLEPLQAHIVSYYGKSMRQKKVIARNGPGYFIRIVLLRLNPHSHISEHVDDGYSLIRCHRIHVPIITSDDCVFRVGESSKYMRTGEMWEINNRHIHAVANDGDDARVHLVFDFVQPGETVFDHEGPLKA